ncbi:CHAT domain-containing protein [Leptolyngbya sp. CCY15150]|uniref:CHAT domain-containing protein n=1 Tax=Leptolyngbya sp. CCY15150 TaxID=2767772 RepID=UPI0019524B24|nr:CHAT domain-containing protein [Leptolyngbya sp. CCY15150]
MARTWAVFFHQRQSALGKRQGRRSLRLRSSLAIALGCLVALSIILPTQIERGMASPPSISQGVSADDLVQQGQQFYDAGRYQDAADRLQQAAQVYAQQGAERQQAIALSNLALTWQHLGNLEAATRAIDTSLSLLRAADGANPSRSYAQALSIYGRIQLAQGLLNEAYDSWGQAADLYGTLEDPAGVTQSRINQAQALKDLGFYRRAVDLLQDQVDALNAQPASLTTAIALRSLGETLQLLGQFAPAIQTLEASLAIATQIGDPDAIAAANLSLGHTLRAQAARQRQLQEAGTPGAGNATDTLMQAQRAYTAAIAADPSFPHQIQIRSSQLSLLVDQQNWLAAQTLWLQLQPDLAQLPPTRASLDQQVEVAKTLIRLRQGQDPSSSPTVLEIANLLTQAHQQAQQIGDQRSQSYALGTLGELYEQNQQWRDAQTLTQDALALSRRLEAPEVSYRWQWQLGRLLKQQQDREGAIAAYDQAIATLKTLRSDVVSINNPEAWLSFRDTIEPVHREFVDLLLAPDRTPSSAELDRARETVEALQLAELDNFFKAACLDADAVNIETIDPRAAVIYPILLSDRLELILNLPDQPPIRHSVPVPAETVAATARELRPLLFRDLSGIGIRLRPLTAQLYDWLIRPLAADLATSDLDTLVFVLDGSLRNIPMAVLFDGTDYLIQDYNIALAPGLQLVDPAPERSPDYSILLAGVSEVPEDSPFFGLLNNLPNVEEELNAIRSQISGQVLLNEAFTTRSLQTTVNVASTPIVHLATHGQFSSDLDNTYVLAWDNTINVLQLRDLLEVTDVRRRVPIELLVFSACDTAQGDDRAALGLAGVAVQAGARSTIGSLWKVDDASTSVFMQQFYQALTQDNLSKAAALRQAQLALLDSEAYQAPYYWAPFILVGNWL